MTHDEGERMARLEAELLASHQIMQQQSMIIAQQERLLAAAAEVRAHMSSDTESMVLECGMIVGARDAIGGSQGYRPLPVLRETFPDPDESGNERFSCKSAWEFSPAQREKVAAGAPLILCVMGWHPPVILMVGERAEVDPAEIYTTEWLNDREPPINPHYWHGRDENCSYCGADWSPAISCQPCPERNSVAEGK